MPLPSPVAGLTGPPFTPARLTPAALPAGGGGSFAATLATPQGFCIAWDAATLAESPVWTRMDDPTGPYIVSAVDIDRGRSYELDRTGTGTAHITLVDLHGVFDPTNTLSPFNGKLQPLLQAAYALQNPVTGTWTTIFRGFVSEWAYDIDATEGYVTVTIGLVDGFAILAAAEMLPGGTFGDAPPAASTGDVYYPAVPTTNGVQSRINRVLNDAKWPTGLRNIFTGNVKLQATVYPPRSQALAVIQDAADAEFPGVSNTFMMKDGRIAFRGRLARFNPGAYGLGSWSCGDQAAVTANPTTVAPVAPPVNFYTDDEHVYTSAVALPQNIADADIAAQYVTAPTEVTAYGLRTWSSENLATAGGATTTAVAETKKFAEHIIANYASPLTRVGQLTFKAWTATGTPLWALVCGVEISDQLHLQTTHVGGGGFNTDFFVEGLHYQIRPLRSHHQVTLAVDVSPAAYYTLNQF